jgi:hypothetical protein
MLDCKSLARLLNGRVDKRGTVEARLPGGSVSFTVRLMHDAPDGFVIFGLRGEQRELAREHVRERLAKLRGSSVGVKSYAPNYRGRGDASLTGVEQTLR